MTIASNGRLTWPGFSRRQQPDQSQMCRKRINRTTRGRLSGGTARVRFDCRTILPALPYRLVKRAHMAGERNTDYCSTLGRLAFSSIAIIVITVFITSPSSLLLFLLRPDPLRVRNRDPPSQGLIICLACFINTHSLSARLDKL